MARKPLDYAKRRAFAPRQGIDVTEPVAGCFRFRLARASIAGAVRIWHGPPLDPVTGEELDRGWRWQAEFNGEPIDFDRVWPGCTGQPIDELEYKRLLARVDWAKEHAPDSSYAHRGRRFDPLSRSEPLPF